MPLLKEERVGVGRGRKEPFYSNATFGMKIPSNE
jgi:hypothetical protein